MIIILLAMIITLSYIGMRTAPWLSVNTCLENPDAYHGRTVTYYREPKVGDIYADGFQLLQKKGPSIRVYADTTGLIQGEYIGMIATFHRDGYLISQSLRIAKNRRYKIGFSVFPVVIVAVLFFRSFRFNLKKCQIELRKNA
jgi:hypothetical protein